MPKSMFPIVTRARYIIVAGALATGVAMASSAAAQGLDAVSRATLSHYAVTGGTLTKILAITRSAQAKGIRTNDGINLAGTTASIDDLASAIEDKPDLMAILKTHGLDARQFILGDLALMQGAMAAQGGQEGQMAQALLGKANAANVAFYNAHAEEVSSLLAMANGETDDTPTPQLSAKDKEELARLRQMQQSGTFKECFKVSAVISSTTYPFAVAAATSHYSVPNAKLEPGTLAKDGKVLQDLSANVAEQDLSDDLYALGRQIELQEGHKPIEVTPAFKAALGKVNSWLDAHCKPKDDETQASGAQQPPVTAPAAAPTPVSKLPSDAPGSIFGQLSANDVAILKAAKGIQLGKNTGPADIHIIFDPEAPYGAKLYQRLRKSHVDLPVRWVPIAYIDKNSAKIASILLNSRNPKQDLNADLAYYDFARSHGGVQPGSDKVAPLPPEQTRLLKAMAKWGGFTPMVIFRDKSGRWLRTGGSGSKMIESVLARAAR